MVSPDGNSIALYYDGSGRNELCTLDPVSGSLSQISDENVPRSAHSPILWDHDGDRLFFHNDTGGDEQHDIHVMNIDGSTSKLVETDGQTLVLDCTPGGESLLFLSDAEKQLNLWEFNLESGGCTQLTAYEQPVREGLYSPDGRQIAYVTNESADFSNLDVYVADADGSNPRRLAIGSDGAEASVTDWHPDSPRLLIGDNTQDKDRIGIYDLRDDEIDWLSDGTSVESPCSFGPDGNIVVGLRTRSAAKVAIVYDLHTGDCRELDLPVGVASFAGGSNVGYSRTGTFLADDRVVMSHATASTRSKLIAYDLELDEVDILLDAEYGSIDPDSFDDAEYVTYQSTDGTEIGAVLWDGMSEDVGERNVEAQPGIVYVHGGPHGQTTRNFNEYVQFFVSRGYSVLAPNYRGSTGRGKVFKNAIRHDWGGMEAEDIREAGRWLKDKPWIDEDRVVVFGGSYGGYSTFVQLTRFPGEWCAGMAWVGITDLVSLYDESMPHYQSYLEQHLGDPEENKEFYRERSPITAAENVIDPLLIVHGLNDPRCPIGQARSFRDALEERGWEAGEDFAYEELGEEGHGSTDIEQKIRAYRIMDEFLDTWV